MKLHVYHLFMAPTCHRNGWLGSPVEVAARFDGDGEVQARRSRTGQDYRRRSASQSQTRVASNRHIEPEAVTTERSG
jgi:hypothetical protein